ncbi:MAG: ABC transporter ATP-binding protein [Clostridia bacterium]|nr:ABC transporter ATP-binding protein [Clostridia bacterium]
MIEVKNLNKSFDGFAALTDASFTVPAGSVTGLVGPNGAGKTTVLNHIAGIYRADSGTVNVGGQAVYENRETKRNLVFIPDDVYVPGGMNALEMGKYYAGLYPSFDKETFDRLAKYFPAIDVKKNILRMSRGMRKQAAFLLAISARPEVLLLDEPVDGLDPITRKTVWGLLMNEVAERNMTVLVSSHNLRELEDVCDRVIIMNKGKILLESGVDELQNGIMKIQLAYDGEAPEFTLPGIMSKRVSGRVTEMIIRGDENGIISELEKTSPLFIEKLNMSLEEIFINEVGGDDDEFKKILV